MDKFTYESLSTLTRDLQKRFEFAGKAMNLKIQSSINTTPTSAMYQEPTNQENKEQLTCPSSVQPVPSPKRKPRHRISFEDFLAQHEATTTDSLNHSISAPASTPEDTSTTS